MDVQTSLVVGVKDRRAGLYIVPQSRYSWPCDSLKSTQLNNALGTECDELGLT